MVHKTIANFAKISPTVIALEFKSEAEADKYYESMQKLKTRIKLVE